MISNPESRTIIRRWGLVLIMLMLLGFLLISCLLSYRWVFASSAPEAIPVSIRSGLAANYGAEVFLLPMPPLQLDIIQDVLQDQQIGDGIDSVPVAAIFEDLLTPVPSVTPVPTSTMEEGIGQLTPTLDGSILPSPTNTISASATIFLDATPTPTLNSLITSTPTSLIQPSPTSTILFAATSTSTSLFAPTPTGTELFVPTKTPTSTQTQFVCQPPDGVWGFVSSIEPKEGTKNVPVNSVIVIVFNQSMNVSSLMNSEVKLTGGKVQYTMNYQANTNRLTIIPTAPLKYDQNYQVIIRKNVLNECGIKQGMEVKTNFTTVKPPTPTSTPDLCKPPDRDWGFVASISPGDGSKNVTLSTLIVIVFDQPMDQNSLMSNEIQLKGDVGKYSRQYNPSTNTLTLIPVEGLEGDEQYEVQIRRNVRNSCGTRQGFVVRIRFETVND